MAKRTIRMKQIVAKISKSPGFKKIMQKKAQSKFDAAQKAAMSKFNAHPITREIEDGPEASNMSGTLGGYGNLFSFIGFNRGSRPLSEVRKLMALGYKLLKMPKTQVRGNKIFVSFSVSYPDITEFYKITPTPWGGPSWLFGIENGMSGFGNYMYGRFGSDNFSSRSGSGLQSEKTKRTTTFRPMEYVSEILREFRSDLKTK